MFDRVAHDVLCDKVIVDDFDSTYNATKQLFQEKRKHIAFISNIDDLSVGKLRERGYNKAIFEFDGIPLVLKIMKGDDSQLSIKTFFEQNKIDGVIAADSASGVMAINIAISLGMKVPKDISVVGFSSKYISNHSVPRLTTIRQHAKDIGAKAADLLINRLHETGKDADFTTKIIKTTLVKSESTL